MKLTYKQGMDDLVEKFNEWADESITSLRVIPIFSEYEQTRLLARIATFEWAKQNLERIKGVLDGS